MRTATINGLAYLVPTYPKLCRHEGPDQTRHSDQLEIARQHLKSRCIGAPNPISYDDPDRIDSALSRYLCVDGAYQVNVPGCPLPSIEHMLRSVPQAKCKKLFRTLHFHVGGTAGT